MFFPQHPGPTQSLWAMGFFPVVKRPELEGGQLSPFNAEFKKVLSFISTSQYIFITWDFIEYKDNFIELIIVNVRMYFVIRHNVLIRHVIRCALKGRPDYLSVIVFVHYPRIEAVDDMLPKEG
jgi:hypothetical protein